MPASTRLQAVSAEHRTSRMANRCMEGFRGYWERTASCKQTDREDGTGGRGGIVRGRQRGVPRGLQAPGASAGGGRRPVPHARRAGTSTSWSRRCAACGWTWEERRPNGRPGLARPLPGADRDAQPPREPVMFRAVAASLLLATPCLAQSGSPPVFRPPAVPLVVHDPYVSCWSTSDRLTDDWPRHWTGKVHALCGLVRIDGAAFRWCGPQPAGVPEVPAMEQLSLRVGALTTEYVFAAAGVELRVTFWSPALPWDLDALGLPVGHVDLQARATDGREHEVTAYADLTGEWVVNTPDQPVEWSRLRVGGGEVARLGCADQRVLGRAGDDVRLDWGWLHLLALPGDGPGGPPAPLDASRVAFGGHATVRGRFVAEGRLPA
ncbi:MAG: DUF5127 domain-containing protein, partial [Planctomycetes bacterium]|nr:DUF5127 domain-containing protein [Planctomycetota bacterium]